MQHRDRFVPGRDLEQVSEAQHTGAGGGGRRLVEIEVGQVGRVDLEHRQVELWLCTKDLAVETPSVVENHRDDVAIEHVTPDGDNVPFVGDEEPGAVRVQVGNAAGSEDLHDPLLR